MKKTKIRAEELLATEDFSEEVLAQNIKEGIVDNNESQIIRVLHSFLHTSIVGLEAAEREQIKNQIKNSVRKFTIKRQLVKWSIAASILLAAFITSVLYVQKSSEEEIIKYAETIRNLKAEKNSTRIILQNGEEVQIQKKDSRIQYDSKGENIQIDADQKVVQNLNSQKSVFNTVIVPYGKRTQITLSEGTKVWLNSGSKLVYPAVFAENKRQVFIDGEAVFEVSHSANRPFIVSSRDFNIKVLGTIFNVKAYSDDKYSSTVLASGSIELTSNNSSAGTGKALKVSPGTMVLYNPINRSFDQQQVNPAIYMSWREGYLKLNSERLEDIVRKLSRYYNIELIINDDQLKNETFSGYLDLKNSPEEVLSIINVNTPINIIHDQEKIIINPK